MTELAIKTTADLLEKHADIATHYLQLRGADNPEFIKEFGKTFSDLIFSQSDEMLEKVAKTKQSSLLNAVFEATAAGASFAKKEVSFIPYEIFKKEKKNGADVKTATGEYMAMIIFDINFQKQQILKLENCQKFFTAEVHEGVEIISDLETGGYIFEGKNLATKPTIGYYACFIDKSGEKYGLFMTCNEIVSRAAFSPQFKADKYDKKEGSIHYEKIVVRNLMKLIPKTSNSIKSILAFDEAHSFTDYEDVTTERGAKNNALEASKKELAQAAKVESKAPKAETKATETTNVPEAEYSERIPEAQESDEENWY